MSTSREGDILTAVQQYRMLHDIYVLLDDGDRRVLAQFGLTTSQYAVLLLLDCDDGRRLTTVSDRLLLARSTITRLVDQLEEAGLVQRDADPHDRRAQRVILTRLGAERRTAAQAAHERSVERRMTVLEQTENEQLWMLLDKLRRSLRDYLDADTLYGAENPS